MRESVVDADVDEPDVENGLRLVALLFAKVDELEQRVAALEKRDRVFVDAPTRVAFAPIAG